MPKRIRHSKFTTDGQCLPELRYTRRNARTMHNGMHPVLGLLDMLELILHAVCANHERRGRPNHVRIDIVRLLDCRLVCRAWKNAIDGSVPIWRDCWEDVRTLMSDICSVCYDCPDLTADCARENHTLMQSKGIFTFLKRIATIYYVEVPAPTSYMRAVHYYNTQTDVCWHACCVCRCPVLRIGANRSACYYECGTHIQHTVCSFESGQSSDSEYVE